MEILVCVKQVPDDSVEISLDPKTGAPALDGVTPVVNAFDTYALEMAVRLKEAAGGEVTVLSIGDESVKNSLKNCLAVGADYAYLAANDAYQSADPEIIAKELKAAKEAIEERTGKKFDIVFCGKETTDFASGQVGTILAKELSAPVTADAVDITAGEGKVTVKQETEEGYCMIESGLSISRSMTRAIRRSRARWQRERNRSRSSPQKRQELHRSRSSGSTHRQREPQV